MTDIISLDKTYVANTYGRFPVEVSHGKGSLLYDVNGKEYIDLGTGIGVTAFGYSDTEWVKAVTDQLNKIQHTSNPLIPFQSIQSNALRPFLHLPLHIQA